MRIVMQIKHSLKKTTLEEALKKLMYMYAIFSFVYSEMGVQTVVRESRNGSLHIPQI
jgi:hypothetical protein